MHYKKKHELEQISANCLFQRVYAHLQFLRSDESL